MVAPRDLVQVDPSCLLEYLEHQLPDTLLFEDAQMPFVDAVLPLCVRRDELLLRRLSQPATQAVDFVR